MRGVGRLAVAPNTKQTFLSTTAASSHALSTFAGRGRGRGISQPSTAAPGKPLPDPTPDDSLLPAAVGHGRGRGRGLTRSPPPPPSSSSSVAPSSSPFVTPGAPGGRGRGRAMPSAPPPQMPSSEVERPVLSRVRGPDGDMATPPSPDRPLNVSLGSPGVGRGKEMTMPPAPSKPPVVNRHLRQRSVDVAPRRGRGGRASPRVGRGAVGVESDDGGLGRGRRGRGGRTSYARGGRASYARGGREGRFAPLRPEVEDEDDDEELYLCNDADGEKLKKRLGEDEAQKFQELLDEASYGALPCPMEEAYNDAVRMNYRIEFEPEYLMEFNKNPDIDETPPISLREALEKMKPFLMEYEGIHSEEDWEEAINDVMKKSPALKRIVDEYGGPGVITAKQQQEELERVAKSVPENTPSSVKRFADRALLSLQSNPGWDFYKKKVFMDSMVAKVSQHYSGNK